MTIPPPCNPLLCRCRCGLAGIVPKTLLCRRQSRTNGDPPEPCLDALPPLRGHVTCTVAAHACIAAGEPTRTHMHTDPDVLQSSWSDCLRPRSAAHTQTRDVDADHTFSFHAVLADLATRKSVRLQMLCRSKILQNACAPKSCFASTDFCTHPRTRATVPMPPALAFRCCLWAAHLNQRPLRY